MIVKSGNFKDDLGNIILYDIDENMTKHKYTLHYWKLGKILHYVRRKNGYNIEVYKDCLSGEPEYQRPLEEYIQYVSEFYKENKNLLREESFFDCSIENVDNNFSLKTYDFYEDKINEYLTMAGISLEQLAAYIYAHKTSPYRK